jgi:hypothetical protein
VEIPVEISIDPDSASVAIKPIGRPARLAENLISALAPDEAPTFLKKASDFLSTGQAEIISPFAPETLAPLLRFAATHLDPEGEFLPDRTDANGNGQPADHLVVSGEWAIYARQRTFVRRTWTDSPPSIN